METTLATPMTSTPSPRRRWLLWLVPLVAVLIVAAAVTFALNRPGGIDAEITSCEFRGGGEVPTSVTVDYTVTNHDSEARGVSLEIEYRNGAGGRINSDVVDVPNVPAGDTVRGQLVRHVPAPGQCVLVSP